MIKGILQSPNPTLFLKSKSIDKTFWTKTKIRQLYEDLVDTMKHMNGAGVAAVQIDCLYRAFVIDRDVTGTANHLFCANPTVVKKSLETNLEDEGCLSLPGKTVQVIRPNWIEIRYEDSTRQIHTIKLKNFAAKACCHELDHLEGILIA